MRSGCGNSPSRRPGLGLAAVGAILLTAIPLPLAGTPLVDPPHGDAKVALARPAPRPTEVKVTASGTSAVVSWKVAEGASSHRVLRSADAGHAGTNLTPLGTATPWADTAVTPGTTYFYQVVAVFPDRRESSSDVVRFDVPLPLAKLAPPPQKILKQQLPLGLALVLTQLTPNPLPVGISMFVARGSGFGQLTDVRVGGVRQTWKKEACAGFDGGDTSILITLGAALPAGTSPVELVWPGGTVSGQLAVESDKPKINSVHPTAAKPGETIAISGPNLTGSSRVVKIGNCTTSVVPGVRESTVSFNGYAGTGYATDGNFINIKVPSHATGTLRVSTQLHGTAEWPGFVEWPVLTGLKQGDEPPGASVWVAGTGLDSVDEVLLDSQTAPITSKAYDQLWFKVPDYPGLQTSFEANLTLRAKIPGEFVSFGSLPKTIRVVPVPKITSISPDTASPGDIVVILGTGLAWRVDGRHANDWKPSATFNGLPSPSSRACTLNCVGAQVPNDATTGPIETEGAIGPVVHIVRTPKLSNFSPSGARVGERMQLLVRTGSPVTSISFGGTVVTAGWTTNVRDVGDLELFLPLPAGAKSGPILVSTRDGTSTFTQPSPFLVVP